MHAISVWEAGLSLFTSSGVLNNACAGLQVSAIVAPGTAGWAQRLSMAVDAVMLDQTSTRMLDC